MSIGTRLKALLKRQFFLGPLIIACLLIGVIVELLGEPTLTIVDKVGFAAILTAIVLLILRGATQPG